MAVSRIFGDGDSAAVGDVPSGIADGNQEHIEARRIEENVGDRVKLEVTQTIGGEDVRERVGTRGGIRNLEAHKRECKRLLAEVHIGENVNGSDDGLIFDNGIDVIGNRRSEVDSGVIAIIAILTGDCNLSASEETLFYGIDYQTFVAR